MADAEFHLGAPALVCRWRLAGRHVPLLNRHVRALAQRTVRGAPLTKNMIGWVKQHIEWSLAEDATVESDGVLMLVVDVDGQAAMSSGAYVPLSDVTAAALAARAMTAQAEASATGVAPEVLCMLSGDVLTVGSPADAFVAGAMSFIAQLAQTRALSIAYDPALPFRACSEMVAGAMFLVSDEHGVVIARDAQREDSATDGLSYEAKGPAAELGAADAPFRQAPKAGRSAAKQAAGSSMPIQRVEFFKEAYEAIWDTAR